MAPYKKKRKERRKTSNVRCILSFSNDSCHLKLLGFFSKYECWVTDLIMPLYHFLFCFVCIGRRGGRGGFVILFCGIGRDELQDKKGMSWVMLLANCKTTGVFHKLQDWIT
jgi:hypothetical protein